MYEFSKSAGKAATALAAGSLFGFFALAAQAATVGHWRFQEIGAMVGDAASVTPGAILDSANAHDGTAIAGPIYRHSPVQGSDLALEFDGSSQWIEIADDPDFELTQSITIEACVKIDTFPSSTNDLEQIFFRGDDRGGADPYYLALLNTDSGPMVRFVIDPANGDAANFLKVSVSGLAGQWLHLAGTLDDANGTMTIYLDGVVGETLTNGTRAGGALTGSNPGLAIGSVQVGGSQYFDGLIDEVRLSDVALTADQFISCKASSDLGVTKTGPADVPASGGSVVFTIQVVNDGPDTTGGTVDVTDMLPVGVSVNSGAAAVVTLSGADAGSWACNSDAGTPQEILCMSTGTLANGANETFGYTVDFASGSNSEMRTNTASVAPTFGTGTQDNNSANDSSQSTATIPVELMTFEIK